jgi:hypothetical protein
MKLRLAALLLSALAGAAQAQLLPPLGDRLLQRQPLPVTKDAGPLTVQVSGTPSTATITWTLPVERLALDSGLLARRGMASTQPATPAPAVKVERLVDGAAPVALPLASPQATNVLDAGPLRPGQALTYRVTVTDSRGTGFKDASLTLPSARDPAGLSASTGHDGSITLRWQPVDGANGYQISGSTLAGPVQVRHASEWRSLPQKPGLQNWRVASLYEPGGVLTPSTAWPRISSRVLPVPQAAYLSRPSPGSPGEAQAHQAAACAPASPGDRPLTAFECAQRMLRWASNWIPVWNSLYGGGVKDPQWTTVAFADTHDLGLGRRVACARREGLVGWQFTTCWASSHGALPAPGQAPDGTRLAALAGSAAEMKSVNIIVTWTANGVHPAGSHFATWEPPSPPSSRTSTPVFVREGDILEGGVQVLATALDSQGSKPVPHACLSCHGGRFDATTRTVVGASLLPLVPSHLEFGPPPGRKGAEESVRRFNQLVHDSGAAPAVREQIQAMYAGRVAVPGATVNDLAAPPGWAQQPGLYRQVIAPYCGSCHFAQTGPYNFASWGNVLQHKQAIHRAVCQTFTMPHSEQSFRRFWTEGGPVLLPGLLAAALGYASCPV